jgi:hypothetical protein
MIYSAGAGAAAAAAAAAMIQASQASGVIVHIDPADFLGIVQAEPDCVIVHAWGGFWSKHHRYLTSFRGLAFFAKSRDVLELPSHCLHVEAKKIWIPGE